jgi:transcriptional regulator with XRE-family HTH domain
MYTQKIIGINIKRLRESKGWSQCKLADNSGLHYTYISGIERGICNPSIGVLFKIALALNVDVIALFKQDECFLPDKTTE